MNSRETPVSRILRKMFLENFTDLSTEISKNYSQNSIMNNYRIY